MVVPLEVCYTGAMTKGVFQQRLVCTIAGCTNLRACKGRPFGKPTYRLICEPHQRKRKTVTPEQAVKARVRRHTRLCIKRGKLVREPCKVCGTELVEAHHKDYAKPLDVVWLCRPHHLKTHGVISKSLVE